jgi:hypothetical protein
MNLPQGRASKRGHDPFSNIYASQTGDKSKKYMPVLKGDKRVTLINICQGV